jgi:Xaa-Pro aminopeptidase
MDCDALLVLQNVDQFYLSGTVQDGVLWFPREGEPVFAVRKSLTRATTESPLKNIVPFKRFRDLPSLIPTVAEVLGLEFDVLPVSVHQQISKAFPNARFIDQSMAIRRARAVKTPLEQDHIRRAAAMLDAAFLDIPGQLREGMEEVELGIRIEQVMRQAGHQGLVRVRRFNMEMYFGAVSFGDTAAYPHSFDGAVGVRGLYPALPVMGGRKTLVRGEPVMVDIVGGHGGYLADASRAYSLGSPSSQVMETHQFILELNSWMEEQLKPGNVPSQIYVETLNRLENTPYKPHFMGAAENQVSFVAHGIGLELDEIPVIAPRFDEPLEPGVVLAMEPKIFYPGIGGAGVENTYIITDTGCERLLSSPMEWISV